LDLELVFYLGQVRPDVNRYLDATLTGGDAHAAKTAHTCV